MVCPGCGTKNSDDNRFCGNCGQRLIKQEHDQHVADRKAAEPARPRSEHREVERSESRRVPTLLGLELPQRETHYPREGYEGEGEAPPVSSLHEELPPEVIEYDNHIPLIAEPGMDRRRSVANLPYADRQDIVADPIQKTSVEPVPVRDVPARESNGRGRSVLTSSSIFGLDATALDERSERIYEEPRRTEPIDRVERNAGRGFLDFSEPVDERGRDWETDRSLHGPSFLGLSSSPEDYEDESEVSHGRRNFALLVLLLLLVLIGLQWRSIRDFGVRYAQGGVHIPGMKTKQPDANASAANANNSTAVNDQSAANSGNGPNIEVAPTQNPNAASNAADQNATPPAANAGQAGQGAAPNGAGATSSASSPSGESTPDAGQKGTSGAAAAGGTEVAANSNAKNPTAKKSDGDSMPQGEDETDAEAASGDTEETVEVVKPSKKKPIRQPVDDTTQFGAAELAQANASSDPATTANLLWKSTAKGNPIAPVQLADMYLTGRGVPKDCDQALVLLRSASAKKNPRARTKLGSLYATGQCVEQDRVQAYHWMTLALQANPGSEWVERNRESLWTQMTAAERQRASRDRQQ